MIPTSSNTADQGCSPVSSNCVIWQGPNLSCINLCKGDTVSDVVYKVGTQLCTLQKELVLTDLDLSCLVSFCTSANPAPTTKTLAAVLDFIIDKVCCLNTRCTALEGAGGGSSYTEPTLNLPSCLQYTNAQGQNVTQLVHNQYTLTLASKFCELKGVVDTHTSQISGLSNRVGVLESKPAAALPTLAVQCLNGSSSALALVDAVDLVADELCALKGVVGTNTAITAAAAKQCTQLSILPSLSSTGTMGNLAGWKPTVTTLSDSIFNLWLTVCDMRGAIASLKDCCGTVDCSAIIIDFTVSANTNRDQVTLFFNGLTSIPSTYTECTQLGSKLTITDSAGKAFTTNIQVVANKNNTSGVAVSLTGSGLNTTLNYTVKLEACVAYSGKSCTKDVTKQLFAPCTNITINSATIS